MSDHVRQMGDDIRTLTARVKTLEAELADRKENTRKHNSHLLKTFLDLKVMAENDESEEILEMLTELTE